MTTMLRLQRRHFRQSGPPGITCNRRRRRRRWRCWRWRARAGARAHCPAQAQASSSSSSSSPSPSSSSSASASALASVNRSSVVIDANGYVATSICCPVGQFNCGRTLTRDSASSGHTWTSKSTHDCRGMASSLFELQLQAASTKVRGFSTCRAPKYMELFGFIDDHKVSGITTFHCHVCPPGTWSDAQAPSAAYFLQPSGKPSGEYRSRGAPVFVSATAAARSQCTLQVPAGSYNDGKTAGACPAGRWSAPGAVNRTQCTLQVPAGSYNDGTSAGACPALCTSPAGAVSSAQCVAAGGRGCFYKGAKSAAKSGTKTTPVACPAPCTSPPGATSMVQCVVQSGPDKGRGCSFLPPPSDSKNAKKTPLPLACPAPCTSLPGATSWAQCVVSSGPNKGRGCGYLPPNETTIFSCPSNAFASPGATYISNCTVSTGADRGRSIGYHSPGARIGHLCVAPCTSPQGATSWAQCTLNSGPNKGRSCGYLTPGETITVPCPSNTFASPGATYISNCTVSTGADRGRSIGYQSHDARIGHLCVAPCTSPQGATAWTQCTLNSGPNKGRSCGYRREHGCVFACPPNSTASVAATEVSQCRCNEGHFDSNTAVGKVSCQKCAVCAVSQYQAKACGAVDSTHGADVQCQGCPARSSMSARGPKPSVLCTDTPSFNDTYGTCTTYSTKGWCKSGVAGPTWLVAWGQLPKAVRAACCACGKRMMRIAVLCSRPSPRHRSTRRHHLVHRAYRTASASPATTGAVRSRRSRTANSASSSRAPPPSRPR